MIKKIITKIVGTPKERIVKKLRPLVEDINSREKRVEKFSDQELGDKTDEFRGKISQVVTKINALEREIKDLADHPLEQIKVREELRERERELEDILEEILPEAFAVVREAARRTIGLRHHDVQLIGGIVLHRKGIAEMANGEGKTLVATLPAYLNALSGKGVHVVTVNDYLARRDRNWMGPVYEFLGVSVGVLQHGMNTEERKKAYRADITYGTNNEFGFDYLRDNMAVRLEDQVQRGHNYAIVDEADSILIDEARTPLIISGPVEHSTHQYLELKGSVERLVKEQIRLVNRLLLEAEKLLKEGKNHEAGVKILQAQEGAPRNKKLRKLLQEPKIEELINRIKREYSYPKEKIEELRKPLFFVIDEEARDAYLTERGQKFLSGGNISSFVLPDLDEEFARLDEDESLTLEEKLRRKEAIEKEYIEKSTRIQNISKLLLAYCLFEKDVDYVVSEGKVIIVDEFTGRLMPGRRWSDGLHQAVEAKEGITIGGENQTLATITIQNYFRMYRKLAGMTGTAFTEAQEFKEIYGLEVVPIPTHRPVIREDLDDVVYRTEKAKVNRIIEEIKNLYRMGRPVLVGTRSVEKSEVLSRFLRREGIPHSVLNAKYHEKEAQIIAQAGQKGAVTIATNMAGRGTDIKLGEGVKELGGLYVIGTERHESRRIDNQLRGRAGRQGDPGTSRFFVSLEDELMRLFGSERIARLLDRLGVPEDQPIEHPWITRAIEKAQQRVELRNFDIRKRLLEYDNVMNRQREVIYEHRQRILEGRNLKNNILRMIEDTLESIISRYAPSRVRPEEWDLAGLSKALRGFFPIFVSHESLKEIEDPAQLKQILWEEVNKAYQRKEEKIGEELMRELERLVLLHVVDSFWRDHLYTMDSLREGIGLRSYGQRDPLIEYKREAFQLFEELNQRIKEEVTRYIFRVEVMPQPVPERRLVESSPEIIPEPVPVGGREESPPMGVPFRSPHTPYRRTVPKIGRNEPCPCGSGKKYKYCCGR